MASLRRDFYEESLARFQELGDDLGVAAVLTSLAELARQEGDYPRARAALEEALALERGANDLQCIATTETNLAYVLYHSGDYDQARALLAQSLRLFREVGSAYSAAWALVAWAGLEQAQGDFSKAATLLGAANALAEPGGAPFDPVDQQDREEIAAAISAGLGAGEWRSAQDRGRTMTLECGNHLRPGPAAFLSSGHAISGRPRMCRRWAGS